MKIVSKYFKSPIYVDSAHQTRINNAHHYGELFLLIKDGVGFPTTFDLNDRRYDGIDGVRNFPKSYIHNVDAKPWWFHV